MVDHFAHRRALAALLADQWSIEPVQTARLNVETLFSLVLLAHLFLYIFYGHLTGDLTSVIKWKFFAHKIGEGADPCARSTPSMLPAVPFG